MLRYGGSLGLTPFMDGLATQSVVFDKHRSCSNWTLNSVVCTLNGRYNVEFGFMPKLSGTYREVVPDRPTLAYWLGQAGFHSILISSNSWLEGDWIHDEGYDYAERPHSTNAVYIYDKGIEKLEEALDEGADRWFLHLHVKEPHCPYSPPEEYMETVKLLPPIDYDLDTNDGHEQARADLDGLSEQERALVLLHMQLRYEGEMRYLDDQLKVMFNDLERRRLLDDTMLVFWSDHGEQFWEREKVGHAYDLKGEENDAIALYWHKNLTPAIWQGPTSHIDITPTILDFFGLDRPDEVTGLPLGSAPDDRWIKAFTVARLGPVQSITRGDMRLHYYWTSGQLELYDLASDPAETLDIFDPDDPVALELWDELEADALLAEPLISEYNRVEPEL